MNNQRPTSVSVIGWVYIVLSILSIIATTGNIILINTGDLPEPESYPVIIGQLVLSIIVLAIAVLFLRGVSKIRDAMEVISWGLLALFVWGYIDSLGFISEIRAGITVHMFVVIMQFFTMVFPFLVIVYFIRKPIVKNYFCLTSHSSGNSPAPPIGSTGDFR